jgi:hypothetical protein
MHSKEYKNLIACENKSPPIIELIVSFKEYWADAIALINQMTILATNHGYGMAAMDDYALFASYDELLANFGTAYAVTQESIKNQATRLAAIQGQLASIQQFCLANVYAHMQQQRSSTGLRNKRYHGGHFSDGVGGGGFQQNNQTYLLAMAHMHSHPIAPIPATSIMRIGTTTTPMAAILTMPTPVQRVGTQDQRTT